MISDHIRGKSFSELKLFIHACLGKVENVPVLDQPYLTTDYEALVKLLERLSHIADEEIESIKLPDFQSWDMPVKSQHAESNLEMSILTKLEELNRARHIAFLKDRADFGELILDLKSELRNRQKIVAQLYAEVENWRKAHIEKQAVRVPWELLPESSEDRFSMIIRHFQRLEADTAQAKYEIERLDKVYSLAPDNIYIGTDEFQGYVVFYFKRSQTAILECPIHGNAIYVFRKGWQKLSKLSKAALLGQQGENMIRIIHSGNWFSRLEWLIKRRENEGYSGETSIEATPHND